MCDVVWILDGTCEMKYSRRVDVDAGVQEDVRVVLCEGGQ